MKAATRPETSWIQMPGLSCSQQAPRKRLGYAFQPRLR